MQVLKDAASGEGLAKKGETTKETTNARPVMKEQQATSDLAPNMRHQHLHQLPVSCPSGSKKARPHAGARRAQMQRLRSTGCTGAT